MNRPTRTLLAALAAVLLALAAWYVRQMGALACAVDRIYL